MFNSIGFKIRENLKIPRIELETKIWIKNEIGFYIPTNFLLVLIKTALKCYFIYLFGHYDKKYYS